MRKRTQEQAREMEKVPETLFSDSLGKFVQQSLHTFGPEDQTSNQQILPEVWVPIVNTVRNSVLMFWYPISCGTSYDTMWETQFLVLRFGYPVWETKLDPRLVP